MRRVLGKDIPRVSREADHRDRAASDTNRDAQVLDDDAQEGKERRRSHAVSPLNTLATLDWTGIALSWAGSGSPWRGGTTSTAAVGNGNGDCSQSERNESFELLRW